MTELIAQPVRVMSPPLLEAEVEQHVYSTVDGQIGNWTLRKKATLSAVPPVGTSFVFSNGPDSQITETVKHAYFYDGGKITVHLSSVITDDPAVLRELATRLDHGWEVIGGPWEDQGR